MNTQKSKELEELTTEKLEKVDGGSLFYDFGY